MSTKLTPEIIAALRTYDRVGWGGEMPEADLEAVHEFMIATLREVGVEMTTAIQLVHMLEGGNWSKGWNTGYGSAQNHYAPKAV